MSNISLIKFLTFMRLCLWYLILLIFVLTHTLFIVQTWSNSLNIILILHLICSILSLFIYNYRESYQLFKLVLVSFFCLLTIASFYIYASYMMKISYQIANLLTLNIMNNDRNESLLAQTLNYYQCCRVHEDILFDSEDERDYFLLFPSCKSIIEENQMSKDRWNNIKTCGSIFQSIIFTLRFMLILDMLLIFILMFTSLVNIWEEIDKWFYNNQRTMNINYKTK